MKKLIDSCAVENYAAVAAQIPFRTIWKLDYIKWHKFGQNRLSYIT